MFHKFKHHFDNFKNFLGRGYAHGKNFLGKLDSALQTGKDIELSNQPFIVFHPKRPLKQTEL